MRGSPGLLSHGYARLLQVVLVNRLGADRDGGGLRVTARRLVQFAPLLALTVTFVALALAATLAPAAAQAMSFSGPTNFATGGAPESITSGDFNSDSHPDLAVATQNTSVSILLGTASGSFTGPTSFPAGEFTHSISVGDFNGDSHLDLVVVIECQLGRDTCGNVGGDSHVSILFGNGTGSFSGPSYLPPGPGVARVAVSDFNGDSDPDLVLTHGNNIAILLGAPGGTFNAPTYFAAAAYAAAVGDFNGDTRQDLAVTSSSPNPAAVSILLGDGTGSFTGPTSLAAGSGLTSLVVSDFNGDSNRDLAVANMNNQAVGTVLILLGDGTGSFSGPTSFPAGSFPLSVASGDFNGDSHSDLAVANECVDGPCAIDPSTVTILLGDGGGAFSDPISFPAGTFPASVVARDFNGDSQPDLAVANNGSSNVSILLNGPPHVSVNDIAKPEGDSGQTDFVFTVSLAAQSSDPTSVSYHTEDGTATTAGLDYTALAVQTLTFAPGETSKTVTVKVTGDADSEPNETFKLVLSDPINASITKSIGVGTIQNDDASGYPRPKGATPLRAALVPAFLKCNAGNRVHGGSLAYASCNPPTPLSSYATVGSPDANGQPAQSVGFAQYTVIPGNLGTPANEADLSIGVSVTDVRAKSDLSDYAGELQAIASLRITDRNNGGTSTPATLSDSPYSITVPCAATSNTATGSDCAVTTTANAVAAGSVVEGKRAIWQFGQFQVTDGGEDGSAATTIDNTLFLKQGIFVP